MSMDWIRKLKDYAPDIAAAILTGGATLPQLAIKAVADATGATIDTHDQLAEYIGGATSGDLLQIKQANNAFKIRMRELDNELVESELGDLQHAREQHKHSAIPAVLVLLLTAMVAASMYMLFTVQIPEANRDISYMAFGQVFTAWLGALAYWNGTTRSSANKSVAAATNTNRRG